MLLECGPARAESTCAHAAWACLLVSFCLLPCLCNSSPALLLSGCFFLAGHCSFRTATCARVGACALPPHWKIAAMAHSTITADFDEPLNVHIHFAAQVAFHLIFAINQLAQAVDFFFRQIFHPRVRVDTCSLQNLLACRQADAEDVCQRNLHPLIAWNVNAGNSSHLFLQFGSPQSHPQEPAGQAPFLAETPWAFHPASVYALCLYYR